MNEVVQLRPKPQEETDFGELIQLYLETRDAKEALDKTTQATPPTVHVGDEPRSRVS